MGAVSSSKHEDEFDITRFNESIATLKSYNSDEFAISDELLNRCYNESQHNDKLENDFLVLNIYNSNIEELLDSARYYLTYYKTAKIQNIDCNHLIENCKNTKCKWDATDSSKQIHFILCHPSCYEQCSRRRITTYSRFSHPYNESIVGIFQCNTSRGSIASSSSSSYDSDDTEITINEQSITEDDEKQYDKQYNMPLPKNKPLPNAPTHHNKAKSFHTFPKNTRNRVVFNRIIRSKSPPPKNKPLPTMSPSKSAPKYHPKRPTPIQPSISTALSMDTYQETAESDQEIEHCPPMLLRNENKMKKAEMIENAPLPPKPLRIIKKKRSQTMRIGPNKHVAFNKSIIETSRCSKDKCSVDTCMKLKVFLGHHQGRKLLNDDDDDDIKSDLINPGSMTTQRRNNRNNDKNGKHHQYYDHCISFHNEYRGECNAGDSCIWNTQNMTELYIMHGHYFHDVATEQISAKQRRQRFSITSKVKYKETLSSLLSTEKDKVKQLDFGYKYEITERNQAKFKNPKEEILNNDYIALKNKEWNDLLKKSVYYYKRPQSKRISLTMKEVVSLKLYTDFDALQRNFRRCFRDKNQEERTKRQKQFYFWYKELEKACNKSKDIILTKIYHGIDIELPPSTFFGVYYGPVSTTISWDVAAGFAGTSGEVIELYPSFGKKGLDVSFLSNFPEEKEVLYIDCSFQIANIYKCDDAELGIINPVILSKEEFNETDNKSVKYMENCIVKAMQMISVDSQVISLNETSSQKLDNNTNTMGFNELAATEKICILHLLYLQYRSEEWNKFCFQSIDYVSMAFAKYRDMFVSLAINVKAVRMEKLSKLLQIFFYTPQKYYKFPIQSGIEHDDIKKAEKVFKSKQPLNFETVCLLFPNAKQISINADNWDFSLNAFIGFLEIFDLNFANVALQDIYIRFVTDKDGKIMNDDRRARKLRKQHKDFKINLNSLRKLGWIFISPSHLHRYGFEPLPELPFLRLFVPPQKDCLMSPVLFRTYSTRFSIASYLSELQKKNGGSNFSLGVGVGMEGDYDNEGEEVGEHEDSNVVLVDHNPRNCILSNDIFSTLQYKDKLIKLLRWKGSNSLFCTEQIQKTFKFHCERVHVLVLDPMPKELEHIFLEKDNKNKLNGKIEPGSMIINNNNGNNKRKNRGIISFMKICEIFPNVQDIFLRKTTFNLRICYRFVSFIENKNESIDGGNIKLERLFFSKENMMKSRDGIPVRKQLNDINWDFTEFEQTVFKKY